MQMIIWAHWIFLLLLYSLIYEPPPFLDHLQSAKLCAKCLSTSTISFNSYNSMKLVQLFPHFTDGDTNA